MKSNHSSGWIFFCGQHVAAVRYQMELLQLEACNADTENRKNSRSLRDVKVYPEMATSEQVIPLRFDGQLYFANVAYFEDALLEAVASKPDARYVLVVGNGINSLDASGEDSVKALHVRLRENGITLVFSGLKKQVLDVMRRTGLFEEIGQARIFAS
jgi:SulP family sulfate permease